MKSRIEYLDALKCFAIILVVLGHVLQNVLYRESFAEMYIFRYIYAFHMPLFMMISGYVGKYNYPCLTLNSIKKWSHRLLVPFVSFTFIIAIQYWSLEYVYKALLYPDNSLWFLWVLFWIKVIYSSFEDVKYRLHIPIWILVLLMFLMLSVLSFVIGNIFSISLIGRYLVFYAIGVYIGRDRINEKSSLTFGVLLLAAFFVLGYFYKFQKTIFPMNILIIDKLTYMLGAYCIAMIACYAIMILFSRLKTIPWIMKKIGKETLGIYGIHVVLINMIPSSVFSMGGVINTVIITLGLIAMSLLLIYLYDSLKLYLKLR